MKISIWGQHGYQLYHLVTYIRMSHTLNLAFMSQTTNTFITHQSVQVPFFITEPKTQKRLLKLLTNVLLISHHSY